MDKMTVRIVRVRQLTLLALAGCALVTACDQQEATRDYVETGEDNPVVDELFAHWNRPGSPGCAVAVSRDGELIYSRGYGYANLDDGIPITPQTVFDVASVTKQFVAASLSMMELDGKLSFDDDVRIWLPELPEYESPITLYHMVYHTSGLRDYLTLFPLAGRDDYFPISHQQILDMMARQQALNFAPGERYEYSNTAFMLLAIVVERISGKSLGEYAQERFFEPLGMTGSLMYDNFERVIPHRAIGYIREEDDKVRMVHNYNFDVPGDGQMYTTVEDLARWNDYLHGKNKPEYYSVIMQEGTLHSGDPLSRAKGLFLSEYRGQRTIHHTGSSWGFRTVVKRFRDAGLGVTIACNDDSAYPRGLAFKIADHYLADILDPVVDGPATETSDRVTAAVEAPPEMTPGQLQEFVGSFYSAELDAMYRLEVAGNDLVVRIEQELPLVMSPVAIDIFEFEFHPKGWSDPEMVSLGFKRIDSGTITGFELSTGSERGIVFEKQE